MCCSTPRPQPGPKCTCTKCQPCLPPPCDPCTSSKCYTETPKVTACGGGSPCDDNSPCRPETPKLSACRPTPPCNECKKMALPGRLPPVQLENFRQGTRQITTFNQPRTTDLKCSQNSGSFRSGQSSFCFVKYFVPHGIEVCIVRRQWSAYFLKTPGSSTQFYAALYFGKKCFVPFLSDKGENGGWNLHLSDAIKYLLILILWKLIRSWIMNFDYYEKSSKITVYMKKLQSDWRNDRIMKLVLNWNFHRGWIF